VTDDLEIRRYRAADEKEWIKCHALVYVNTNERRLLKSKPAYKRESIELVAVKAGEIVGFLDLELEDELGQICYKKVEGNGMLWELGVLPEHRRRRIATNLLNEALRLARRSYKMKRLEAWTIEEPAKRFYESYGFTKFYEYHHVLISKREKLRPFDKDGLHIIELYAHVMPEVNLLTIKKKYQPEVFVCCGYELRL
jgi:ribosomal protein S18 acetylase RimI-like enzyme